MYVNNFRSFIAVCSFVGAGIFLVAPGTSIGETKTKGVAAKSAIPAMSREDQIGHHEQMIGMHTKIITCLKSEAPIADCNQQMMTACNEMHGGSCPMMGGMMGGMMGKGMKHQGTMPHGTGMMSPGGGANPDANDSTNSQKK